MQEKLNKFAKLLEKQQIENLHVRNIACQANINNCKVTIKPGKKYVKVDVGSSGKYIVDADGNIFGIKGYGVIHRGRRFGTLDTIDEWDWGGYGAVRIN